MRKRGGISKCQWSGFFQPHCTQTAEKMEQSAENLMKLECFSCLPWLLSVCSKCGGLRSLVSQWRQWPQPLVKRFPPRRASLIKRLCSSHRKVKVTGSGARSVLTLCSSNQARKLLLILVSEALIKRQCEGVCVKGECWSVYVLCRYISRTHLLKQHYSSSSWTEVFVLQYSPAILLLMLTCQLILCLLHSNHFCRFLLIKNSSLSTLKAILIQERPT